MVAMNATRQTRIPASRWSLVIRQPYAVWPIRGRRSGMTHPSAMLPTREACVVICGKSSFPIVYLDPRPLRAINDLEGSMPRRHGIRHAEIVRLFAARLREVRMAAGMTQAHLARQATVT